MKKSPATCGRRTKVCAKCGHRYTKEEYELWRCPNCGHDRHCQRSVSREGDACRKHGGKSLKGIASPRFRSGRYSEYWPKEMLEDYLGFVQDPRILSLDQEIATIRTLLSERIRSLGQAGNSDAWEDLRGRFSELRVAFRDGNQQRAARATLEIGRIIDQGSGSRLTRLEIRDLADTERKLVETQRQMFIDLGEFITRGMALVMFSRLIDEVKKNVAPLEGGRDALRSIGEAAGELVGRLDPGTIPGRDESPE